jgi:Flp pilus assembly protein TadG
MRHDHKALRTSPKSLVSALTGNPHHGGTRGQSMVETALVLPIIILLLVAIIDFGLLFNNYIVLSNATREAARKAAVGATDTVISETVASLTGTLDQTKLVLTITPAASLRKHGVEVTVLAEYENLLITPIIGAFFEGGSAELASKTVMRVE